MLRLIFTLALFGAVFIQASSSSVLAGTGTQDELPIFYEGDGLLIAIDRLDEDQGTASGRMLEDGRTLSYRGRFESEILFRGTLRDGGKEIAFTAREKRNGDLVVRIGPRTFTTRLVARPSRPFPAPGERNAKEAKEGEPSKNPLARPERKVVPKETSLYLEPRELRDPGSDDRVSHRLLVPRGWELTGGPQWNPQLYKDFVHLKLRVQAPDGREMAVHPGGFYSFTAGPLIGDRGPRPGQVAGGQINLPPPESSAQYVTQVVLPRDRPAARQVEVVSVTPLPEIARMIEQRFQGVIANARANDRQALALGYRQQTRFSFEADRVRVRYREGEQLWEEDVQCIRNVMQMDTEIPPSPPYSTWGWGVEDLAAARAPAGTLDDTRFAMEAIGLSLRPDPRWQAMVLELQARINRQEMQAIVRRGEIMRQANEEAFAIHQETIRSQNESRDRMNRKFVDMIRDVDAYSTPDGGRVSLPSFYDRAFSDGQGGYLLTNDANLDPNVGGSIDWTPIQRARD